MKERVKNARNEGMFTPPGFTDTISMPGNQGGSNWGTTAADPQKGMVFVVGVNQVAILKLEDVTKRTPRAARWRRRQQRLASGRLPGLSDVLPKSATAPISRERCRASPRLSASPIAWVKTPSRRS